MPYRLVAQAIADLDEIEHFIAFRKGNPVGAQIVSDYLFEAFEAIARDPRNCGGREKPNVTSKLVKFLTVRKYVVIYDDRVDPVLILGVVGLRRNLRRLLSDDRFPRS